MSNVMKITFSRELTADNDFCNVIECYQSPPSDLGQMQGDVVNMETDDGQKFTFVVNVNGQWGMM
jgi:hypothetical protein